MFKTITERIGRIIQGFDMMFPADAFTSLTLFKLIADAQKHVQNKTGQKPTVLVYSPTLSKLIAAIEAPLANELGIIPRKEPRVPNDQLMLVANEVDVAVVNAKEETFLSFLDRQEAVVGVVFGDAYPNRDLGDSVPYHDTEIPYSHGY